METKVFQAAKETIAVQVVPEREKLVCACYERLGYTAETVRHNESGDAQILFRLNTNNEYDAERMARCEAILAELFEIDREVTVYYLKRVCLVGLIGALCIGLSFLALHGGIRWLFTALLVIGIFGCTITLSLRPLFTRLGMKQFQNRENALLTDLQALLGLTEDDLK